MASSSNFRANSPISSNFFLLFKGFFFFGIFLRLILCLLIHLLLFLLGLIFLQNLGKSESWWLGRAWRRWGAEGCPILDPTLLGGSAWEWGDKWYISRLWLHPQNSLWEKSLYCYSFSVWKMGSKQKLGFIEVIKNEDVWSHFLSTKWEGLRRDEGRSVPNIVEREDVSSPPRTDSPKL